jgi:hypothetical protein
MPVFPFFVILPAMLITSIEARSKKIASVAMLLLCGCCVFNAARESNIENIFRNKPNEYVFTHDKDTPVYGMNAVWSSWKYANLIPYVHDEQAYYFIDWYKYYDEYLETDRKNMNIRLPEAEDFDTIYLLTEYIPDAQEVDDLMEDLQTSLGAIESAFEINTGEQESEFPYYKGKKIIMNN